MIRFKPDTWPEAFLRFFAMAAPDGNVYVEIAAPDLRFAAMALLAGAAALCWRRLAGNPGPAAALLVLLLLATASWLVTSGNGRYFMPMLLCVGPLVAGLIYLLPLSRSFRLLLAAGLLAAQTFVVASSSPWDAWAWLRWEETPYFHVQAPPPDPSAAPTTYVTLTSISYSLIAPQFPPASRWINITTAGALARDRDWAQDFLRAATGPVKLVAPSIRAQSGPDGSPLPEARAALDALLAPQRLALEEGRPCVLLPSGGMAAIQGRHVAAGQPEPVGFWICSLRHPVEPPAAQAQPVAAKIEAAFARIEQACPRFFQPGTARTMPINGGLLRHYAAADIKIYVLDDGQVLYKFWRALNPVVIGTVEGVLRGTDTVRCDQIRGRAGLPWDREI